MPDPYATIARADEALQARLAAVLELRAADPQQRAMLDSYLAELELPRDAAALEVGCGTGAVTRVLALGPGIGIAIGIDPSRIFIERARELGAEVPNLSFETGDAQSLRFADASFDLVVFHTSLCHVPDPARALTEAHRILRAGATLVVFDGDYMTTTVAIDAFDPLQRTVDAMLANYLQHPWLIRRLARMLRSIGFDITSLRGHAYTQVSEPSYLLTIIERGAEALVGTGGIGAAQGEALVAEAHRRVEAGEFFGHISFVSVIARKAR